MKTKAQKKILTSPMMAKKCKECVFGEDDECHQTIYIDCHGGDNRRFYK